MEDRFFKFFCYAVLIFLLIVAIYTGVSFLKVKKMLDESGNRIESLENNLNDIDRDYDGIMEKVFNDVWVD